MAGHRARRTARQRQGHPPQSRRARSGARAKAAAAEARVSAWANSAGEDLARWQRTLNDMRAAGTSDFATLSVGIDAVRKLTDSPQSRA